ncbi:MAG: alpha/beta hydrolase [Bacteroidota bacterium]|nr:alpha/beta hydrolase [Bacteroidota bacterium]
MFPVASKDPATPSKLQYVNAHPLSTPDLPWFIKYYLNTPAEVSNPLIDLVNANLSNLPSTTVIGAELDPLQSEGKTLADKLTAAGVKVNYKLYLGVTHEFFGMSAVVPQAEDAENLAAVDLKKAFQ